jgi:large subunit ribosomal protein L1
MDKNDFIKALEQLRQDSQQNPRKFKQGVDLIINLKGIDFKKPEQQIDLFVALKFRQKKAKICGIVGGELASQSKANLDFTITPDEFPIYSDKKVLKKLAKEYDWFVAQANIMIEIAKIFGRVLGQRGKMPNPKAGCVVPPNANLKVVADKLRNTIKVAAKSQPSIKRAIGNETMTNDEIAENAMMIYGAVAGKVADEAANIKNVMLKFTMSKPVQVGLVEKAVKGAK